MTSPDQIREAVLAHIYRIIVSPETADDLPLSVVIDDLSECVGPMAVKEAVMKLGSSMNYGGILDIDLPSAGVAGFNSWYIRRITAKGEEIISNRLKNAESITHKYLIDKIPMEALLK